MNGSGGHRVSSGHRVFGSVRVYVSDPVTRKKSDPIDPNDPVTWRPDPTLLYMCRWPKGFILYHYTPELDWVRRES